MSINPLAAGNTLVCTWGTVTTDALGLKHQDFGIHSACPLTHKQLETHRCGLKIVATGTDTLVIKPILLLNGIT